MKYIDTEKLKAEIRRVVEEETPISKGSDYYHGVADTANKLLSFITSLQQEQEQYVIGGQVFGATDVEQLYEGKVYIISNLVQDTEFGIEPREKVKMLLIKD